MKIFINALILFAFSFYATAQMNKTISYGENIDLGIIEKDVKFTIVHENDEIILQGEEINNYKFNKPGSYIIQVVDPYLDDETHSCTHTVLPQQFTINVSRVRMKFHESVQLSQPIRKNVETRGITLSVPITIQTYDHKEAQLNTLPVNTSGIGTSVVANYDNEFTDLSEGEHVLKYSLSGVVTENSYIMFDFVDANGNIQSVSLLSPINN